MLEVADPNCPCTSHDWLVCGGPKCQYKGRETNNGGVGNRGFVPPRYRDGLLGQQGLAAPTSPRMSNSCPPPRRRLERLRDPCDLLPAVSVPIRPLSVAPAVLCDMGDSRNG